MQAAVLAGPGRMEARVLGRPDPGAGQVQIRSAFCGICGTDLAMLAGSERIRFPAILGHEWSGVVEAVRRAARMSRELEGLVTHTVGIREIERGIGLARSRSSGALRVLIDWGLEPGGQG